MNSVLFCLKPEMSSERPISPQIASAIRDHAGNVILDSAPETGCHALNGGSLLHRMSWKPAETAMDELHSCMPILLSGIMAPAHSMSLTVTRKGRPLKTSHIRVDGIIFIHLSASLLKHSSMARKRGSSCQLTSITRGWPGWYKSDEIRNRGCTVINAQGDDDVLTVKAAVEKSLQHITTLIGEDTDLLVLYSAWVILIYYA